MTDDTQNTPQTQPLSTPQKPPSEAEIVRRQARQRDDYRKCEHDIDRLKAQIRVHELDKQAIELQVRRERLTRQIED